MKKSTQQLLLTRRKSKISTQQDSSSDGLLDLLSNVLGVLVLVSSLTGVLAATSALNIQAPMRTETKKEFWMLQASEDGIWDLQPAIKRMTALDRERVELVRKCDNLLGLESQLCEKELDRWGIEEQVNGVNMKIDHEKGIVKRLDLPTISSADIKENNSNLSKLIKNVANNNQAVFIVLESDGFEMYRQIKRLANRYKVPIGWEPWYKEDPIYFWGNAGRSMLVQ